MYSAKCIIDVVKPTEPGSLGLGDGEVPLLVSVLQLGKDVGRHGHAVAHRVLPQVGRHRGQDLHVGAAAASARSWRPHLAKKTRLITTSGLRSLNIALF